MYTSNEKRGFLLFFGVFAFALLAGAATGLAADTDPSQNGSTPPRQAASCYGQVSGPVQVWDFTESVPEGGTLRKGAKLQNGLVPTQLDNAVPVGFALTAKPEFQIPEAFLFEAEFTPGLDWDDKSIAENHKVNVLWDNMYVTYITDPNDSRYHRGFQLAISDCGNGYWQPILYVGFGRSTDCVQGPRLQANPGETVKLSFFYGANRTIIWNFAGQPGCGTVSSAGPIAASKYSPVIGDRFGSNYCGFNGTVKRVSITPYQRQPIAISFDGRGAFVRGEKNAGIKARIENFSSRPVSDVQLTLVQRNVSTGSAFPPVAKQIAAIPAGESAEVDCSVETRVQPGWYSLDFQLTGKQSDGSATVLKQELRVGIGPRFADRFPALIWMFNNRPYQEVLDFGFTHGLTGFGFGSPEPTDSLTHAGFDALDRALVEGFQLVKSVSICFPPNEPQENFMRTNRDGTVRLNAKKQSQPEVSNPVLQEYNRQTATANARVFGTHPAFGGVLPNSERRDGTFPSFRTEASQYQAATGREVPPEVSGNVPPQTIAPARFPEGVVPEDDPLLQYYRWFWTTGDGWPGINSAIAKEYRNVAGRYRDGSPEQKSRPFFSFYDPAVRVPPRWGSGGDVDVLSQWVYAVPEPLAVAGPVEELFAMANGSGQDVMIMTQIICYRSQIAPKQVFVAPQPGWVQDKPDADFPTIPPDSLQEATWSMIAKPVQGIMYHGYACIVETGAKTGYTFTNGETSERMRQLLTGVVAPLGPTLKRLPRVESPVAVLESFTSTIFAGHGTWGWIAPDLTFFQRARLDPRVVYEETILRDGLGNAKVLYAPQCDYLTQPVIDKIREFQKAGGVLVADELLCKALKADILVPVNKVARPTLDSTEEVDKMAQNHVNDKARQFTADAKQNSLAEVERLRQALNDRFKPRMDSSSPELITFARQWDGVDYLFVVNDKRTFGDYVGQWGMTMERGLPFEGFATIADPDREIQAIYELSRGGKVDFKRTQDERFVQVPLKYETNDGRLLLFLKSSIQSVETVVPSKVKRGDVCRVEFRIYDEQKKLVHALLPVEIRLFDAKGVELDGGGFACAENGSAAIEFQTNLNDAPGPYKAVCRDRASGFESEKSISQID